MTWIDDAQKRAEAATPGPWHYDDGNIFGGPTWHLDGAGQEEIERHGIVCSLHWPGCEADDDPRWGAACENDEEFIAHARTDLPHALKLLEEARELLRQTVAGDWSHNDAYDRWIFARDALLKAIEEGPR